MLHKLVGYKVLIKCFHGKLNVSLFSLYLNKIVEPILILLQFLKVPIVNKCP